MCRRNRVLSAACLGFGTGILVGIRLEGGFFCTCIALGAIALGILFLQKQV